MTQISRADSCEDGLKMKNERSIEGRSKKNERKQRRKKENWEKMKHKKWSYNQRITKKEWEAKRNRSDETAMKEADKRSR